MSQDEEYPERHPSGGHPLQSIELDEHGVARFKANRIVRHLLDFGTAHGMGMNALYALDFPAEDWEQLAQLIGYSVSGFNDLSYASDAACEEANAIAGKLEKKS